VHGAHLVSNLVVLLVDEESFSVEASDGGHGIEEEPAFHSFVPAAHLGEVLTKLPGA